jgi:hypothetical protein
VPSVSAVATPGDDVTAEEATDDTVRYQVQGERTFFHFDGKPVEQPIYYTQRLDAEACRFRHWDAANWVATWDVDEYLIFPQGTSAKKRTRKKQK